MGNIAAPAAAAGRRRFAAFLTAKDLVLGYARTATEGAGRLAARLHLAGLFTMVRRSYGWLLGAASEAARGLQAPGVLAGLVWGSERAAGRLQLTGAGALEAGSGRLTSHKGSLQTMSSCDCAGVASGMGRALVSALATWDHPVR